jgi:hypothetical protein
MHTIDSEMIDPPIVDSGNRGYEERDKIDLTISEPKCGLEAAEKTVLGTVATGTPWWTTFELQRRSRYGGGWYILLDEF